MSSESEEAPRTCNYCHRPYPVADLFEHTKTCIAETIAARRKGEREQAVARSTQIALVEASEEKAVRPEKYAAANKARAEKREERKRAYQDSAEEQAQRTRFQAAIKRAATLKKKLKRPVDHGRLREIDEVERILANARKRVDRDLLMMTHLRGALAMLKEKR